MILRVVHSEAEEELYRDLGWEGTDNPKILAWHGAGIPPLPDIERSNDRTSDTKKDHLGRANR